MYLLYQLFLIGLLSLCVLIVISKVEESIESNEEEVIYAKLPMSHLNAPLSSHISHSVAGQSDLVVKNQDWYSDLE